MTDATTRLNAALPGRYHVERPLGEGGMATVYLAADLKHDRKVAIKVLKPELAAVLGAERFVQEIKTTAALSHPHILPLFDSGEAAGLLYYVMPYIEGETIREKLDRETQLGVEEAVRITTEVADALDYAHRHGVIHRDIKPENILLHDGRPMVMDFGIALAVSAAAGGRMTETGLSLGTPHYMSPEQATADKTITARSDVYSLASVLYEMLTGEPPHTGGSAQAIIMKIVTDPPRPVGELRRSTPPNVTAAVAKALEKVPADRFESARVFAEALSNPAFTATGVGPTAHGVALPGWHRYAGPIIAALSLVTISATVLAVLARRSDEPSSVLRVALALPADQGLTPTTGTRLAWAPDGKSFVYATAIGGGNKLWHRRLDALEATPIEGTEDATSPFFSPDGSRIGFVKLDPFSIWLVPSGGGATQPVVRDQVSGGGGSWSDDGYIYFDGLGSLARIRPDGTGREPVYSLDSTRSEIGVGWPDALPNGRGVLFRLRSAGEDIGGYRIMVTDLRSRQTKLLVRAPYARFVAPDHLLYVTADGSLMAARFDPDRLELRGDPVLLWRGMGFGPFGSADLAVSRTGSLLYATGTDVFTVSPTWVSRDGEATTVDPTWPEGQIFSLALSPDGSQLAVEMTSAIGTSSPEIWVKQLDRGPLSRLTFVGTRNRIMGPAWSADGRDLLFASDTSGTSAVYWQRADGSSPARLAASARNGLGPGVQSPDGRWLVLESDACCDIVGVRIGEDGPPVPLVASPAREEAPALSPDARWLAYVSDETGQSEVYVRPFPDVQSGKWQVSTQGGVAPQWSHRGDEIFYLDRLFGVVAARVTGRPSFAILGEERLFPAGNYFATAWRQRGYAVSPDDRRLLMLRGGSSQATGAESLVLVQGFLEELQRKVP